VAAFAIDAGQLARRATHEHVGERNGGITCQNTGPSLALSGSVNSIQSLPISFDPHSVEALLQRLIETMDELRLRIAANAITPPEAQSRRS
jgi:hypothetical protein